MVVAIRIRLHVDIILLNEKGTKCKYPNYLGVMKECANGVELGHGHNTISCFEFYMIEHVDHWFFHAAIMERGWCRPADLM